MNQKEVSNVVGDADAARPEQPSYDELLDLALLDSFPASDPPALVRRGSIERASAAPDRTQEQARALERADVSDESGAP